MRKCDAVAEKSQHDIETFFDHETKSILWFISEIY